MLEQRNQRLWFGFPLSLCSGPGDGCVSSTRLTRPAATVPLGHARWQAYSLLGLQKMFLEAQLHGATLCWRLLQLTLRLAVHTRSALSTQPRYARHLGVDESSATAQSSSIKEAVELRLLIPTATC